MDFLNTFLRSENSIIKITFGHALHTWTLLWCKHFLQGSGWGNTKTYCYERSQAVTIRHSIKASWRKDGSGLVECAAVDKVGNMGSIFKCWPAGLHYDEIW